MNVNGAASMYQIGNASWLNPAASLNNQRLANAMKTNPKFSKVPGIGGIGGALSSDAASFMKDYQSKMTGLMTSANALRGDNLTSVANELSAQSADTAIAEIVSEPKRQLAAQYELDVRQTAASQVNAGTGADSFAAATASGSMSIVGSGGTVSFQIGQPDGQSNKDLFGEIARQINDSKIGVTASVVEKDGTSALQLTSSATGAENAFSVTGEFAAQTGLTATKTAARDAVYTVAKDGGMAVERTSSSNLAELGGITAAIKGTGKTAITVGPDNKKFMDAVKTMVDSYNSAVKFLDANENMGVGVLKQLKKMIQPPTSLKSMEKIGITPTLDGTLKLDAKTLEKALVKDSAMVRNVISGSAGMAQGIYKDAQEGMKTPSASLVNGGGETGGIGGNTLSASQQDPINFMSGYSKSGVYNMMNYFAVGALMNFNV